MKKKLIITCAVIVTLLIVAVSSAIFISFKTVKPTTDSINQQLASYLKKIVRIPQGIPALNDFSKTMYFWEMETLDKEVVGVHFNYETAYLKDQDTITVELSMPEKSDPSIFTKVLPALIADPQSLQAAQDPKLANLNKNEQAGYENLKLSVLESRGQTAKITWTYKKGNLPPEIKDSYAKLEKFPTKILKTLFSLPSFVFGLLGA